eukprot:gene31813-31317_t
MAAAMVAGGAAHLSRDPHHPGFVARAALILVALGLLLAKLSADLNCALH